VSSAYKIQNNCKNISSLSSSSFETVFKPFELQVYKKDSRSFKYNEKGKGDKFSP
jgi:hypothetical protein